MSILIDWTKNEKRLINPFWANITLFFNAFQYYAAFYNPWKRQKNSGFLLLSGVIKNGRILENIEIMGNIDTKWVKSVIVNYLHIMTSLQTYTVMSWTTSFASNITWIN